MAWSAASLRTVQSTRQSSSAQRESVVAVGKAAIRVVSFWAGNPHSVLGLCKFREVAGIRQGVTKDDDRGVVLGMGQGRGKTMRSAEQRHRSRRGRLPEILPVWLGVTRAHIRALKARGVGLLNREVSRMGRSHSWQDLNRWPNRRKMYSSEWAMST